jgi:hypothetical protein
MRIWFGLKAMVKEGTGMGANARFLKVILAGPQRLAWIGAGALLPEALHRFISSAESGVQGFGPTWAKRRLRGLKIGTWILLAIQFLLLPGFLLV